MALAVDLPGDGREARADRVVARGAGGGAGVLGDVGAKLAVDDHALHQVGVVVVLVVVVVLNSSSIFLGVPYR